MTRLFIATKTATYAMKCRDLLKSKGYNATVEKRTSMVQGGCSYGVVVNANKEAVQKIFSQNGIKVFKIYEI